MIGGDGMFINVAVDSETTSEDFQDQDSADTMTPRQVAATIFSRRLADLISESVVSTEDGLTRSLTLYALAQHLELAYPDVPVSQSGLYRLMHGEAIPRLDLIIALARVFDVPPEYFVTGDKES
ncbi:helix-turn-helix domain-containing protein [Nocardia miyunensis]|uniref:helix-turn-helix domain-containing protein n=1 Tax=Nocardia miyunensis TaxID=282684 RepID=UPI001FDFB184|nr:helix-turn-helix transcriptional regulator [Nocardia miyunensis]